MLARREGQMDVSALAVLAGQLNAVVRQYRGRNLTEQDTKNAIIEPIMGAIGWPKHELQRVRAEYRHTSKDNPIDYALLSGPKPVLFVEAKALDKDIEEHKFVAQTLSYANVAGVAWAVITNGFQWDLYCVFAKKQARDKRFFSTRLDAADFGTWMGWLTPDKLDGNELEVFWRQLVAERAVRESVISLFALRDVNLVTLLAQKTGLATPEVASALEVLTPSFGPAVHGISALAPPVPPQPPSVNPTPPQVAAGKAKAKAGAVPGVKAPAPPPVGTKPTTLTIEGSVYSVSSWREGLLAACQHVAKAAPKPWSTVFNADAFATRKRRYLDSDAAHLRTPLYVPGGYVEGNLSADDVVRLIAKILVYCGLDPGAVSYEIAVP